MLFFFLTQTLPMWSCTTFRTVWIEQGGIFFPFAGLFLLNWHHWCDGMCRYLIFINGWGTGLPSELSHGKINPDDTTRPLSLSYSYGNITLLKATACLIFCLSEWLWMTHTLPRHLLIGVGCHLVCQSRKLSKPENLDCVCMWERELLKWLLHSIAD